ncbi:MAG: Gfo/Idh/MocA family protein [Stackebrandtia sp.]
MARRHPMVDLRAVWDENADRGRERAAHWNVSFESDLETLLARDDIQAVSLCAPPRLQPALVEAAAAAGKDIAAEKVIAADMDGAARIVQAVRRHGVRFFPAFNIAFNPIPLHIKSMVESGRLGSLSRVRRSHGHYGYAEAGDFSYPSIAERAGWGDPHDEGRGALFFVSCHQALWFQWMFGPPRSVVCMSNTLSHDLPVEDNVIVLLRYPATDRTGVERGFTGVIESSATQSAVPVAAQLSGAKGELVQYRGCLPSTRVWGPQAQPLAFFDRAQQAWCYPELPPYFTRSEFEFTPHGLFLEAVVKDRVLPVDEMDGYHSVAMLAAAERAEREGREVDLPTWPPQPDVAEERP